jgi:hypothetical protein
MFLEALCRFCEAPEAVEVFGRCYNGRHDFRLMQPRGFGDGEPEWRWSGVERTGTKLGATILYKRGAQ